MYYIGLIFFIYYYSIVSRIYVTTKNNKKQLEEPDIFYEKKITNNYQVYVYDLETNNIEYILYIW